MKVGKDEEKKKYFMIIYYLYFVMICIMAHLLINLKDFFFDTAFGTSPNLARMCG